MAENDLIIMSFPYGEIPFDELYAMYNNLVTVTGNHRIIPLPDCIDVIRCDVSFLECLHDRIGRMLVEEEKRRRKEKMEMFGYGLHSI